MIKEIRAIWGIAGRLGINATELHQRVENLTGKKSIRLLTRDEAQIIIHALLTSAASIPTPVAGISESDIGGTDAQKAFIAGLGCRLGWDLNQIESLAKKMYGIRRLKEITNRQASGLIEALKAIRSRKAA